MDDHRNNRVDLSRQLGLDVELDTETCELNFGNEVDISNHSVRTIDDMADIFVNLNAEQMKDLYHMYRGVIKSGDRQIWENHKLRFDLTVLKPGRIGNEYIKTAGHYHPSAENSSVPYPELYIVVCGKGLYVTQKPDSSIPCTVTDVLFMSGNPGIPVVVLPGYGHITVNVGNEPLVMANVTADGFSSIYEPIKLCHGAAYYVIVGESDPQMVPNSNYRHVPSLRYGQCMELADFGLNVSFPIYHGLLANIEKLMWLISPDRYREFFNKVVQET